MPYQSIKQFGQHSLTPMGADEPLTFCLADTMDKNFLHGQQGQYGPRSRNCQLYMAERCANNWDGWCEYFYREHGKLKGTWPDNRVWANTVNASDWKNQVSSLTIGEQLLKNTAERKYCEYPASSKCSELFDPMNPFSPRITYYRTPSSQGSVPICRVDPKTIDQDVVMNRVLDRLVDRPEIGGDTLINICNTSRREGIDLSGTKLGGVCQKYFNEMK